MIRSRTLLVCAAASALFATACQDVVQPSPRSITAANSARRDADPSHFATALAPQRLVRTRGAADEFSFVVNGYGPSAILHVRNGDVAGNARASSASISVDGAEVVSPNDFSQKVASLDVPIQLANPGAVRVRLASAPGSEITISITAEAATQVVVPATGGTLNVLGDQATLTVPAGAAPAGFAITAEPVTIDPSPANVNAVGGSAVEFGPTGTQFSSPITITLHYDPARTPTSLSEKALRLATLVDGKWVEIKGSSVDPVTHTVTGQTTHFSTYGVVAFQTFTQVTLGDNFACGLTAGGDAYCWGMDNFMQLGSPATTTCVQDDATKPALPCSLTPQLVTGGIKFVSISAADSHVCGVTATGDGYCWGGGMGGKIGDGNLADRGTPTLVTGGYTWSSIVSGNLHTCGLTTDGTAYCWGFNNNGQLGAPAVTICSTGPSTLACNPLPTAVNTTVKFREISLGLNATCALTSGGVAYCWGGNSFGVLGDGTRTTRNAPRPVLTSLTFDHISTGGLAACGLSGTTTYCWGTNSPFRMLGVGTTPTQSLVPMPLGGGLSTRAVAVNNANNIFEHACVLATDGSIWCWGGNDSQQLGVSVSNETCSSGVIQWACNNVPVQANVPAGPFLSVAVGISETCGTATDGETYCWGYNRFGQIGDGTTGSSRTYTRLPRP